MACITARRVPPLAPLLGAAVLSAAGLVNVEVDRENRRRSLLTKGKPKVNLHAPYGPYRGPLEPRTPLKSDAL